MTSKTIQFTSKHNVECVERTIEKPQVDDFVLIETETSIISVGTELACLRGSESWAPFPFVPGYGSVGRVIETGSQTSTVTPGDRVFTYGRHEKFSFANTVIQKIPEDLPARMAVFARMAAVSITALRVSDAEFGDKVAVFGLGLVGNLAAQLFTLSGCEVIGIDPSPYRRQHSENCGIFKSIHPDEHLEEQINELTSGLKCRTVVDATGIPSVVEKAPVLAGKNGELILLGSPRGAHHTDLTTFLNYSHLAEFGNITIKGAHEYRFPVGQDADHFYRHSFESNVRIILEKIRSGKILTDELVSHQIKPEESPNIYENLLKDSDRFMGVLINWESTEK